MSRGSLESSRSNLPQSAAGEPAQDGSGGRLGSYLRRLREGYGYTLRRVEERAQALGESIDNSQLSRFEKGKAVPSFEKLRALARIFNVPVQSFSDVFDLEEFEPFKPETGTYDELLRDGRMWFERGEYGRAFVTYERALERAEEGEPGSDGGERAFDARWRMATALKALGNLAMAEHELREILRNRDRLTTRSRMRTLLQLAYLYRERGDLFLASVLARECLELARSIDDVATAAGVWNTLGNIAHDEGRHDDAMAAYREALELLERTDEREEMRVTLMINFGGCMIAADQFDQGVRTLREAHAVAVRRGFRRAASLALTRLGESYLGRDAREDALRYFTESDRLASRPSESYHDILFLNAYRRWEMACKEGRGTPEKIAFGRLRHLRSLLQRRFPEVDAFDRHVERTRRHA